MVLPVVVPVQDPLLALVLLLGVLLEDLSPAAIMSAGVDHQDRFVPMGILNHVVARYVMAHV